MSPTPGRSALHGRGACESALCSLPGRRSTRFWRQSGGSRYRNGCGSSNERGLKSLRTRQSRDTIPNPSRVVHEGASDRLVQHGSGDSDEILLKRAPGEQRHVGFGGAILPSARSREEFRTNRDQAGCGGPSPEPCNSERCCRQVSATGTDRGASAQTRVVVTASGAPDRGRVRGHAKDVAFPMFGNWL